MNDRMIDGYRFGKIIINGKTYQKDLIIFPDKVIPNWRREQGHCLGMNDLKDVVAVQPNIIIIGTGMFGRMIIPQKIMTELEIRGIDVIAEKTDRACQIFNQRQAEDGIIAALHLTC